jgi:thioredoxin 1
MENEPQMENESRSAKSSVHPRMKTVVLVVGVLAVGAVMALTGKNRQCECGGCLPFGTGSATSEGVSQSTRPRLLDLGATTCIPCKKMIPVLEELKTEYEGRLDVEFIDVWRLPGVANQYGVQSIPTQIFFDVSGKELYRHEGFFAKDDILKKWRALGVDLTH